MDKGIYTALSGGVAKSHELELIANNLANANTPGFKRDTGTFNEYLTEQRRVDSVDAVGREINAAAGMEGRPVGDKSFVEMDGIYTDFKQGGLEQTHRRLDVGIEGKGFFEVLTPNGVRYTRQGSFSIGADGRLVTQNGFPVLSRGEGSAQDPAARAIRLGQGPVDITNEGTILQNGNPVGTLGIQEFHETQWLEKVGNSYFRNTDQKNLKPGLFSTACTKDFSRVLNVNPVHEMTRLIEATRAYESHMQAIKTYQEIDGRSVNEIAKER